MLHLFVWASKVFTTKSTSKKSTGKPHQLNAAVNKNIQQRHDQASCLLLIHDYREPFRSAVVLALTPISSRCVCRFAWHMGIRKFTAFRIC